MTAPQVDAKPRSSTQQRRIPIGVRVAILGVLDGLNAAVLTDAEFADDIARAVLDAWEAVGVPALTVARRPGGGWYWECTVDGEYCACGSQTNWYGWPAEIDASDEGRIHIATVHGKGTS